MSERALRLVASLPRLSNGAARSVHASTRDAGDEPAGGSAGSGGAPASGPGHNPHHHRGLPHEGRLGRFVAFADTTRFWVVLGALGLIFVFGYAFANNRTAVGQNNATIKQQTALIRDQRAALGFLCSTVQLLDAVYVQQIRIDQGFLRDKSLSVSVRDRIRDRIAITEAAHLELSDTRPCRRVE